MTLVRSFLGVYRLVLRHQLTRGRVILVVAATGFMGLMGLTVLRNADDPYEAAVRFVAVVGLGLILPVISLLLGSSAMGEWYDDETLVYVWLRPVRRVVIAAAATAAAWTVTIPMNLLPMVVAVVTAGEPGDGALSGAVVATFMVTLAYTAVFVVLGITFRRPLAIGLIYIFIWEFFVSRGAAGAARLSINSYGASILARSTEIDLTFGDRAAWATTAVPLSVAAVAIGLSTLRLQRMEVA